MSQYTYVVASSKVPHEGQVEAFFESIKAAAAEALDGETGKLEGIILREGPGCMNYGFLMSGLEPICDEFMKNIAMALFPSKWSGANPDPDLQPGVFADLR